MKRWKILKELWLPFSKSHISRHAAAASFYMLISLLPAAVLTLSILSVLSITTEQWTVLLNQILPDSFRPLTGYLLSAVTPRKPIVLISSGAILTLWSASKGILSISDGIAALLGQTGSSGLIRRRLDAMAAFLLLALILLITLSLHVFAQHILLFLQRAFPKQSALFSLLFRLRFLYSALILGILLTFLYWLMPGRLMTFQQSLRSGIISSFGWVSTTALFSLYVNYFRSDQAMYGGLGLLLLSALWLQISISMLLYSVLFLHLVSEKAYHPILIIRRTFGKV